MKFFRNWSYLIFTCIFFTCTEEETPDHGYPTVTTSLVEISTKGVKFSGTIQFEHLEGIIDHGFVWGSEKESLSLSESHYISLGPVTSPNFSATIGSTLANKAAYYTRSFAKTKTMTVYGPVVKFVSLGSEGPSITAFAPMEGGYGDTLIITGKNFVFKKELNLVTIGDVSALVARATDTELKVVVPGTLTKISNAVKVSILDNASEAPGPFKVKPPVVQSVANPIFTVCDTIFIQGENLGAFGATPTVRLNGYPAWPVIVTPTQIKVMMPALVQNPVGITISSPLFEITPSFSLTQVTPEITSIEPLEYFYGDTITVSLKNWPACHPVNPVLVGQYSSSYTVVVTESSPAVLKFIAPQYCLPSTKLQLWGNSFSLLSTQELKPHPPTITSIEPNHGTTGDEVVIRGKNFPIGNGWYGPPSNLLESTTSTSTEIRGKVTDIPLMESASFEVYVTNGCTASAAAPAIFTFDAPEIYSISPTLITRLDEVITITGNNFSSSSSIEFAGLPVSTAMFGSIERDRITIPASELIRYPDLSQHITGKIKITTGSFLSALSSQDLTINYESIWRYEASFPGTARSSATFMTINGKGYTGLATTPNNTLYRDWWEFDPLSGWTQRADFPENDQPFTSQTAVVDGKGYVGFFNSTKRWWQYDPSTNQWNRKADFPGTARLSGFTFAAQGKVYVGGGTNISYSYFTDFWEYDPATDHWTQKASLPSGARATLPTGFEHHGKGFTFGLLNGVSVNYSYDPATNEWITRTISPFNTPNFYSGWGVMKFANFAILHSNNYYTPQVYKYNPDNNTFVVISSTYGAGPGGMSTFVIDNRGYMGLGHDFYTSNSLQRMLSFDAALLK